MKMKEKTISFDVRDLTGSRQERLSVPVDWTIGQIRPQIIESLGLSDSDNEFNDEPATWTLYRSDPEQILSDADIVGEVIKENQTVMPVGNIVSGGA